MDEREVWSKKKSNICYVDEEFFTKWSPNMAYILGFFAADGCLTINSKRNNKYIEFVSTDKEIIENIKKCLKSNHKIGLRIGKVNCKDAYRLQIGSKKIFQDLVRIGFMPNKSNVMQFLTVPAKFLSHFVRGYFDGDGHSNFCHFKRKNRPSLGKALLSGFTSGSKDFLQELQLILQKNAQLTLGTLCFHLGYRLAYASKDSNKLFKFIYKDCEKSLYIVRKHLKFKENIKRFGPVA
ncbi:MAG: LAGLIDADG family homing endonuclease [Patescibacteria group bacterium]|nr:LAGLIDADG family homing endonuclease [Patescibacteria group bacterium]